MSTTVRRLVIAVVLVLVLLALVGYLLLNASYDSEALGRAVLERAGAATGLELAAEGYSFRPLSGLKVRGLTARGTLPAGHLDARLERLSLSHEFWPLLWGRVVVHEIILEQMVVSLTPGAAPSQGSSQGSLEGSSQASSQASSASPASSPPEDSATAIPSGEVANAGNAEADGGLQLNVQTLRLEDAEITLHSDLPGEPPTVVRGLDVTLHDVHRAAAAPAGLAGLVAEGEMAFEEALLGELTATEGESSLGLRDGHLRLTEGELRLPAGPFRVEEVDLDLTREPFAYLVDLAGEPLATGELLGLGARGTEMAGLGDTRLTIRGTGEGSAPEAFRAEGGVEVEGGTLPPLALLSAIDSLVDGAGLVGEDYQPLELRFDVADARVSLAPFRLVAGSTELGIEGWAGLDGRLQLAVDLVLPRAGVEVKEVPRELLDALTDEAGRLHLPLEVVGDAMGMRVVPDADVLQQAVRDEAEERVQQEVEKQLVKGLQSLFGSEDEEGEDGSP